MVEHVLGFRLQDNDSEGMAMIEEKILIVEDENIVALDIKNRVEQLGYDVCGIAATGEEAIRKTEKTLPDLVLMDIKLKSDMDGIDAAGKIRERFNIPVVYLTAYADEQTLERAKITEPSGYLIKPIKSSELRSAIEIALYKHKLEKRLKESEEEYRDLFENANDLIQSASPDGRLIHVNRKWKEILGYGEEDLATLNLWDIIHVDSRAHCEELFQRVLSGEEVNDIEAAFVTKDGKVIAVHTSLN